MWSFCVTLLLSTAIRSTFADFTPFNNDFEYMSGKWGNYSRQRFLSDEKVIAPVANILVAPQPDVSASKHMLWVPMGPSLPSTRPMILDTKSLSTVWYSDHHARLGAHRGSCNGTDYIYHWSQTGEYRSEGRFFFFNSRYELVHNLTVVGNFHHADPHDLWLTPQCTAIFPIYRPGPYNLTTFNVTDGWIEDSYFQEVDLLTNERLFQWRASNFIDPVDTYAGPGVVSNGTDSGSAVDWFHINSIQKDHYGNFLVSSRHMHALYYVSGSTGNIIWTIGGKRNAFRDMSGGKATNFAWQHHARWVDQGLTKIQLFDNRNTEWHSESESISRGIVIRLDYARREVWLEHEYKHHPLTSIREGSMQVLTDSPYGNTALVGYGSQPAWTEFSEDGSVIWDVALGPMHLNRQSADNYRTLKFNWTGNPQWKPRISPGPLPKYSFNESESTFYIALRDESGASLPNNTVYVSWNGATEIKQWIVLASNTTSNLTLDHLWAEVPKSGFEESCFVGETTRYVIAWAINDANEVIGHTDILTMDDSSGSRAFSITDSGGDLTDMTLAWQKFVRSQLYRSILTKIQSGWKGEVRIRGAGIPSVVLLFGLLFSIVAGFLGMASFARRSRRGRQWKTQARKSRDSYSMESEETPLGYFTDLEFSEARVGKREEPSSTRVLAKQR
ncbi:hypothetical protein CAC42_7374 [Sphaceloma murrayae]|uniref:ASST-domain-containing protein n=1 Tax=Sphaceloma murrayae TaxID=2082308 RepID=A0A2K1QX38_9PEZI|nr:hypothetical protein CAC42_7374 [Sphaceloma murrayae]